MQIVTYVQNETGVYPHVFAVVHLHQGEHMEVEEWCNEHMPGRWCRRDGIYHFKEANDAFEFKMRWAT